MISLTQPRGQMMDLNTTSMGSKKWLLYTHSSPSQAAGVPREVIKLGKCSLCGINQGPTLGDLNPSYCKHETGCWKHILSDLNQGENPFIIESVQSRPLCCSNETSTQLSCHNVFYMEGNRKKLWGYELNDHVKNFTLNPIYQYTEADIYFSQVLPNKERMEGEMLSPFRYMHCTLVKNFIHQGEFLVTGL